MYLDGVLISLTICVLPKGIFFGMKVYLSVILIIHS